MHVYCFSRFAIPSKSFSHLSLSDSRIIIVLNIEILPLKIGRIGAPVSIEPAIPKGNDQDNMDNMEAPSAPQLAAAAVPRPAQHRGGVGAYAHEHTGQQQPAAAAVQQQPVAGYRNQVPQQEPQRRPEFGNPAAPRANSYGGWKSENNNK